MIEHNGKLYARVSEILAPFTDFSRIHPYVLENKANLGTIVHEAINDVLNDRFPVITKGLGYLESFEKWWDLIKPTLVETESRYFCHEKMITGQIDCIVKLPHSLIDLPVILDWKTSASPSPTWEMQACLYSYLIYQSSKSFPDKALFIRLNKNGDLPRVHEYIMNQNIYTKCMHAIDDFWEKNK